MSGLVDAHVHVWDPAVAEYPWMLDTPELRRRFDLDHLGSEPKRLGVDGVVLVQAADNVDDTNNMLTAAERHPCVLGIVAWVPLTTRLERRPDSTPGPSARLSGSAT